MSPFRSFRFTFISLAAGGLFGAAAVAQTATAPAAGQPDDDTVSLPDFAVHAEPDGSYMASESVTGSRVAEKIKNLPFNIQVLTSEFIDEFAFFDLDESFTYTSSFGDLDAGGGYNIRGFGATKALRNGFPRFGLIDRVNVDRIEIIKGPSAAVYGETRPGGLINIVTKKPKTKPGYKASLAAGSYGTVRSDLEATGPLGNSRKTAYLLNAAYYERSFQQDFARTRQKTISGAISHKFSDDTNVLFELEYLARQAASTSGLPAINDSIQPATQRRTRLATELGPDFNPVGPKGNFTNREITAFNFTLEHRLTSLWSMRAAANYFNRNYWTMGQGGDTYDLSGSNAGKYGSRSPSVGAIYEDGGGFQMDSLIRYYMFNRQIENRTLVTLDYSTYWRVDPQWRLPSSGPGSVADLVSKGLYAQRLDPKNPNYATPSFSLQTFPTINRYNDNRTDVVGGFIRHQISAWKGRAIIAGGVRYDVVRYWLQDKKAAVQAGDPKLNKTENYHLSHTTPNVGANVGLFRDVRGYLNYAKSFFPDSQNVKAFAARTNEGGYGFDYGVKTSAFDEKLNFTLGGFYVLRTNVGVDAIDEITGLTVRKQIGTTLSRGVELDANWRFTRAFSSTFGYGYTKSQITENGKDIDVVGRQTSGIPQHNAYLTLRYAFRDGMLKGFTTTFGVTYKGATYPFADDGGLTEQNTINGLPNPNKGLILSNDGRREIKIPGYYSARAGVRYRWRPQGSRLEHSFGVNVTNLFNQHYVQSNRRYIEPISFSGSYSVNL